MIARWHARIRRLLCDRKGATAVEFAIVAPVLLLILFPIFEAGWLMTRTIMQDSAVDKVVRQLRVNGNAAISADEVKHRICDLAVVFDNCEKNTSVELKPMPEENTFPGDVAKCIHRGTAPAYVPGTRSEFMYVRVCTTVQTITPGLGLAAALQETKSGDYGIVTAAAFVNEPQ